MGKSYFFSNIIWDIYNISLKNKIIENIFLQNNLNYLYKKIIKFNIILQKIFLNSHYFVFKLIYYQELIQEITNRIIDKNSTISSRYTSVSNSNIQKSLMYLLEEYFID